MPPAAKAKEEVLAAAGMLSPQPKVNPHEATKKLEIQLQSNLTNPTIPSEGQFLSRALNLRKQNNNINSNSLKQNSSTTISTTTTATTTTESARSSYTPYLNIRSNTFTAPSASRSQSISIPISNPSTKVINPTQPPSVTKPHFVPQPVVVLTNRNKKRNSLIATTNTLPSLKTPIPESSSDTFTSTPTSPSISTSSPSYASPTRPITPQLERRTSYLDYQVDSSFPSSQPQKSRRVILPYGGAKSDGLLNQHAFISCNVIAAAERRKKDPSIFINSTTSELPLEKVIFPLTHENSW